MLRVGILGLTKSQFERLIRRTFGEPIKPIFLDNWSKSKTFTIDSNLDWVVLMTRTMNHAQYRVTIKKIPRNRIKYAKGETTVLQTLKEIAIKNV